MTQLELAFDRAERGMDQAEQSAGESFGARARACIVELLRLYGPASGEALVDGCKERGVVPANDDRAFGGVFYKLIRDGAIEVVGEARRAKGHASLGGKRYALVRNT